jgi:hypothetical protein
MELHANLILTELREPDDFGSLKVIASQPSHVWVTREELAGLAGDLAEDAAWRQRLQKMFEYAASHGWLSDDGAVRAHVEWAD